MSEEVEQSELEKEFIEAEKLATKEIEKHLAAADLALNKAIKISEKYGVPFNSSVSHISQQYVPDSFESKFGALDEEELENLGIWLGEYGGSGWNHSAVC